MEAKEIFKNESMVTPEKEWSEQRNLITPPQLKIEMHKTGKQKMWFFYSCPSCYIPSQPFLFSLYTLKVSSYYKYTLLPPLT